MTAEYDCPTCLTLKVPVNNTMTLGKIHYMDSRYYLTCGECNLTITTNEWRRAMSMFSFGQRGGEEE